MWSSPFSIVVVTFFLSFVFKTSEKKEEIKNILLATRTTTTTKGIASFLDADREVMERRQIRISQISAPFFTLSCFSLFSFLFLF